MIDGQLNVPAWKSGRIVTLRHKFRQQIIYADKKPDVFDSENSDIC